MSVKLSDLVNSVTNDIYSSPIESEMAKIAEVTEKVNGGDVALRIQIENKLRSYNKKKISEQETYNILVLTDYVSQKSIHFRTQVCELSFITILQQTGKMKKNFAKANNIEQKIRELISIWGVFYPSVMCEYAVLYKKYCYEGVINPMIQPTIYLPNEITKLLPHVEHNIRNLTRAFETGVGDIDNIYKHAKKINSKFNKQIAKIQEMKSSFDPNRFEEIIKSNDRLTTLIRKVEIALDERNMKYHEVDYDDVATSVKEGGMVYKPTNSKMSINLMPPPSANKTRSVFPSRIMSPCMIQNNNNNNNNNVNNHQDNTINSSNDHPTLFKLHLNINNDNSNVGLRNRTLANRTPVMSSRLSISNEMDFNPDQNINTNVEHYVSPGIFQMDDDLDNNIDSSPVFL